MAHRLHASGRVGFRPSSVPGPLAVHMPVAVSRIDRFSIAPKLPEHLRARHHDRGPTSRLLILESRPWASNPRPTHYERVQCTMVADDQCRLALGSGSANDRTACAAYSGAAEHPGSCRSLAGSHQEGYLRSSPVALACWLGYWLGGYALCIGERRPR